MEQLTRKQIESLPEGVVDGYHVRLTRLYYPTPVISYEGPAGVYVQRRPDGSLCLVTTQAVAWAEGGGHPSDWHGDAIVVEDYMMEIFRP